MDSRQAGFLNALIKPPCEVLRTQLHALCAWHVVYLEALGSPFLSGRPATPGDLRLAVRVCSLPLEMLEDSPRVIRALEGRWWKVRQVARTFFCCSFRKELVRFYGYLRTHSNHPAIAPPVGTTGGGKRTLGAPWVLARVHQAGGEPRHWTMPLDRLEWEAAARAEASPHGALRWKSEEELMAERTQLEARREEVAANA